MNPEYKDKWLRALRDKRNENTQVQGVLRSDDGYCALGHLCNVYDPTKWKVVDRDDRTGYWTYIYEGQQVENMLPWRMATKLGITQEQLTNIAEMNDDEGLSLTAIADWIEANL